jgi:drug/metabolite transporter, DME family
MPLRSPSTIEESFEGRPNAGPRSGSARSAVLLVSVAAALSGTTGTAQAFGHAGDPVAVGAGRLAVGGGALVLITLMLGGRAALRACLRRRLLGITVIAAVALAVCQSAFFSAVASTGVATGTVVALGTAPVATGLCAAVVFGERLTRWWVAATALAVAGCVVLVTAGSSGAAQVSAVGVALAAVAGTCYGAYTTAAKALLNHGVPATAAMAVTLTLGGMLLAPVLFARGTELAGLRSLAMLAWIGLVATAGTYLLFARGLARLSAATVSTLNLAEPLVAAGLGLLVLGERPGARAAVGALCLLIGLVLAALRPTQEEPIWRRRPVRQSDVCTRRISAPDLSGLDGNGGEDHE